MPRLSLRRTDGLSASRPEPEESPATQGFFGHLQFGRCYEMGTLTVSEAVPFSNSVRVADPEKSTSVTVAVHFGFGHEPAGADGSAVLRLRNLNWPFVVVGMSPVLPEASNEKL
jgi:hypothetical protein